MNDDKNRMFDDPELAAFFRDVDSERLPHEPAHTDRPGLGSERQGFITWGGGSDPTRLDKVPEIEPGYGEEPERAGRPYPEPEYAAEPERAPEPDGQGAPEFPADADTPLTAYLNTGIFVLILVVLSALSVFLPKPTSSEYEKRELAKLPEFSIAAYMTSQYNADVEAFYADTFPARDGLVRLRAILEDVRGLRVDDVKLHGSAPLPSDDDIPDVPPSSEPEVSSKPEASTKPEASSEPETSSEPVSESSSIEAPPVPDDGASGEMVNNVFVYKDMAMELFGGSRAMAEYYASVVNDYAAKLGPSVKVYNVVVPTHVEFALPDKYKSLTNSEKKNIDYIYSLLDPSVTKVDAYSKLALHSTEYTYFKTDHHWTGLGAYYAYTAFAEAAGFKPYEYSSYVKHTITPFTGSLYGVTGQDPRLLDAGDYVEWCEVPVEHKAYHYLRGDPYTAYSLNTVMATTAGSSAGYSVYLYGDYPLTVAETGSANGRRALVIKESYGNAFSTYLVPHFEKTFIADERYFLNNLQDFVKQNGITDVIIVNNCFAANTNFHITNISNLLYQTTPTPEQVQIWKQEAAAAAAAKESEAAEEKKDEDANKVVVEG